jgi:hypothetical protein
MRTAVRSDVRTRATVAEFLNETLRTGALTSTLEGDASPVSGPACESIVEAPRTGSGTVTLFVGVGFVAICTGATGTDDS